jgi:hypothetical protein
VDMAWLQGADLDVGLPEAMHHELNVQLYQWASTPFSQRHSQMTSARGPEIIKYVKHVLQSVWELSFEIPAKMFSR